MDPIELIAVAGGILLTGFIFWSITSLIRFWVNKRYEHKQNKNVDIQKLREFEEFRRKTERRLQNLEAVFVEDEELEAGPQSKKTSQSSLKQPDEAIEIEDEEQRRNSSKEESKSGRSRSSGGKLPNMLEQ